MPKFKIIIMVIFISLSLQSCKLWPYRSDFDCPLPDGYKCKSLYEINNLADKGVFEETLEPDDKSCHCRKIKN